MPITATETMALAEMLRIGMTPADAARLAGEMSAVLECAGALDATDVSGAEPMTVGVPGHAPLREDEPGDSFTTAELEALSGGRFDAQSGQFVTKAIFGQQA